MTEREIFVAALNQPDPAERRAFLDRACGGDAEARARVEALLAAHDELGSFLEGPADPQETTPVEPAAFPPPAPAQEEEAGVSIGPYKLLEMIGEGGMGTVWMADQARPIRRRVAVKVVKAGMDSKQVVARFEAERQALALMDHPNIAKVLDAGSTASGRPYFVMELVRGVPLTKFCDDRHLGATERLRVFQQVCNAVQHAHQKGVIHRDLKPTNVLVESHDGKPVPKVIDFGLAKAVGAAALTERSLFTHFGAVLGTPLYMSPEQAEFGALDVDTRADVYALGVLLYELLTGTTPIERGRLAKAAWDEIRRVIKEEEPPAPSARLSSSETRASVAALRQTEPAKLGRFVRGDLDWVVMKALAKERDRRYESASALAADVERFLNLEPVSAGPPTTTYRLRKFARRNKATLAVTGLVLFFLVLIGSGVGWVVRDRSAREAEVIREREARQAATDLEANLAIKEAEGLLRQGRYADALSAAKRAEGILAGGGSEEHRERARELQKDARMAVHLDDVRFLGSGLGYGAMERDEQYTQAFREYGIDVDSLEPRQVAEQVAARIIRSELVVALDSWAYQRKWAGKGPPTRWNRLIAAARAADADELRNRVRDAMEQGKVEVLKDLAASPRILTLPPTTLVLLGTALNWAGVPEDLAFLRAVQRQYPGDFSINYRLATALQQPRRFEQWDEVLRWYSAALAIRPQHAGIQAELGRVLNEMGQMEEAIACYYRAIELDPKHGAAHNYLSRALAKQGKLDEAIAFYKKCIERDPNNADLHAYLGLALARQGKPDEAIAFYKKALELDPKNAGRHNKVGLALAEQGKLDEAIACLKKAVELDPKLLTKMTDNDTVDALFAQGFRKGGAKGAGAIAKELVAVARKEFAEKDPLTFVSYLCNYAERLSKVKAFDEAEPLLQEATAISEQQPPETQWRKYRTMSVRGECLVEQQRYAEAERLLLDGYAGIEAMGEAVPDQKHFLIKGLDRLIVLYTRWDKPAEAIASYKKAIALDPNNAERHNNLGIALAKQGKLDEAIACYKKGITLEPENALAHNNLAWLLATCTDAMLRDPALAVKLAKIAVELDPKDPSIPSTLGTAYYRTGEWKAAITALEKSMELRKGGDSIEWFILAMAHWQLGDKEKARAWYEKAVEWMDKNQPNDAELRTFREEATELLGLKEKKD